MFRTEGGYKPKPRKVNIVFMNGGVGDHVAALTAVDYMIKRYTWITYLLWVPDFLADFSKNVLPEGTYVRSYSDMEKHYDMHLPTHATKWDGITSPMKIHVLDYAFLKLCDENPSIEHKNYLPIKSDLINISQFQLPEKYVVLTTAYTANVREFPANEVNKIADWTIKKGYIPVFLGQSATKTGGTHVIKGKTGEVDFSKGLNLMDKTSLLEAAKIMDGAKAVVGVDNGLLHLAGCTNAHIIAGFTTVRPSIRLPVRNDILGYNCSSVVPDESLECKFCQERTNFIFDHDYVNCIYKDRLCVSQMTAEKFIKHLEGII
jgi:hypothetical protein